MANMYHNGTTWELPFSEVAELELQTDFGQIELVPVEPGTPPRLELSRGAAERVNVHIDTHGQTVRVRLEPDHTFHLFGGWESRAIVYVPRNVRAHVQTNAGSVRVRDLEGCELGIKANAGKIELVRVHGVLHLGADAGSITGQDVGGFLNFETQAGSVRLEVSELQPGEHRVRATMGSVRLELARGLDVCIETRTSLGSIRSSYPSHQAAATRLVLSTDMGSLRIEESPSLVARPSRPPQPRPEPAPSGPTPEMGGEAAEQSDPELERILKMVEAGELSAQDADELLRAMGRV
jgi:hypothetical protein